MNIWQCFLIILFVLMGMEMNAKKILIKDLGIHM
ncbi:Uncharacterised protein [Klebsiella pneumoniae]|nr:Uncharacterised protein [Klebsiella pneumoniae]